MKVLHVCTADLVGGAQRAAHRLHVALAAVGVESRMLVRRKSGDDPAVEASGEGLQDALERLPPIVERKIRAWTGDPTGTGWSMNFIPSRLVNQINRRNPDIVHLHWVGAGYLPVAQLGRINRPIVWTLHDLWPLIGVHHYEDADFERGSRSIISTRRPHIDWETVSRTWKRRRWRDVPVTAVSPTPWCKEEMARLGGRPAWTCEVIPHGLDLDVFKPRDTSALAAELGLDPAKKVIVFGALNALGNLRKGADLLGRTLHLLRERGADAQLVIFGDHPDHDFDSHGFPLYRFGPVRSDDRLAEVYSLGDVFILPSREETFGQTASESLACGVPVVAFRAAGQQHVLEHKVEGYLASAYDPEDMALGIEWAVERSPELGLACRRRAEECYNLELFARRHRDLYAKLLNGHVHASA